MLDIKNQKVAINEIYGDCWVKRNISLSVLRLDTLHPTVGGNKIFKLHYFLQKAIELKLKIITFGGAYSNHLAATAAACNYYGLQCIGLVRGEKPINLSSTLSYCLKQKMRLEFITRNAYKKKEEITFKQHLQATFGDHILMQEGGFSEEGVRGAAEICKYIPEAFFTHICCSVGTATTLAGIIQAALPSQHIIGFSALKELDINQRLQSLLDHSLSKNYCLIKDYHFGGYAKKSTDLISFMNTFFENHAIPLDFVYTGKMMYGVIDLIRQNHFAEKSRIICIHTGGLQGNASLSPGTLQY